MKEEIGTYRKNQKGFGFVKLEGQEEEIYISKENSYNALNGDTVAIKIISEKEADKKAEGKIVKIICFNILNNISGLIHLFLIPCRSPSSNLKS